jgi:hypothetical protein
MRRPSTVNEGAVGFIQKEIKGEYKDLTGLFLGVKKH